MLSKKEEGATAIFPAGTVIGIVTGTEGTQLEVATGTYNQQIDARITEIDSTCGLNQVGSSLDPKRSE